LPDAPIGNCLRLPAGASELDNGAAKQVFVVAVFKSGRRQALIVFGALVLLGGSAIALLDSQEPEARAELVTIDPHRATYVLKMASARNGSQVVGVSGEMSYLWGDACDGWTTEQRFDVRFLYAEDKDVVMSTRYATWESKDGRNYRFNIRKLVNEELDEELKGEAVLNGAEGGSVHYELPDERELTLLPGTRFPSAHTIELIGLAKQSQSFFVVPVFDGSEAEGATSVSAVVGKPAVFVAPEGTPPAVARASAWPVSLSFFSTDIYNALPEYESSLSLLDNGVVGSMLIDYGDFKVAATLKSLEAVPKPPC
jgi:hypothetical protein